MRVAVASPSPNVRESRPVMLPNAVAASSVPANALARQNARLNSGKRLGSACADLRLVLRSGAPSSAQCTNQIDACLELPGAHQLSRTLRL